MITQQDAQAVRHALRQYQVFSETKLGRALSRIRVGESHALDLLKYEITDVLYADFFSVAPRIQPSLLQKGAALWLRGQWDLLVLKGILEGSLHPAGHALEDFQTFWRTRFFSRGERTAQEKVDLLFCGYLASAPSWISRDFRERSGLRFRVLHFDDYFRRQSRFLSSTGIAHQNLNALIRHEDWRWATQMEKRLLALARTSDAFEPPLACLQSYAYSPRLARHVRRIALQFRTTVRLLKKVKPRLIVLPDERQPLARAVARWAKQNKIASVSIPEANDQVARKIPPLKDTYSQFYITMTSSLIAPLCRAGLSPSQVTAAEFPHLQTARLAALSKSKRKPKSILFPCQGLDGEGERLRELVRVVQELKELTLVIRPHPRQRLRWIQAQFPHAEVSRTLSTEDALNKADVIVTYSSLMAVEAVFFKRPVLVWSPQKSPELLPLLLLGVAEWVPNRKLLKKALQRSLNQDTPGFSASPLLPLEKVLEQTASSL